MPPEIENNVPKTKKTKHIIWVLIIILLILIIAAVAYFVFDEPSPEMNALQTIEKELPMPKADYRKVDDKGCYFDGKGAQQYDRNISFSFKPDAPIPDLISKLKANKDWVLLPTYNILPDATRFKKVTGDACIFIDYDKLDGYHPYFIILSDCLDNEICFGL